MKKLVKIFWILCIVTMGMGLFPGSAKMVKAAQLADGYYEIEANLVHASIKSQKSMGDAAIEKPIGAVVRNGKVMLKLTFSSLTIQLGARKYKGYLGELNYLEYGEDDVPTGNETIYPTSVSSYYEEYDSFNDPETGTDPYMMSLTDKRYPKEISMPVEEGDEEIWVQVYVPVMEAINAGGGRQYARLQIQWNTAKKIRDLEETEIKDNSAQQLELLKKQIEALKKKAQEQAAASQTTATSTPEQTETVASAKKTASLDKNKLPDGVYSIQGKMVKIDKKSASMSNEAIGHTLKLTVKKGNYYITLDFCGMAVNDQFGYLGSLKYFKTGYKLDKYGNPVGQLGTTTVKTYQKDAKGNKIKDNYGTDYPDQVMFPLIKEAVKDGYVPLQVFVPIMEGISKGTGTQPVFLKLDWSTLKKSDGSVNREKTTEQKKSQSVSTKTSGEGASILDGGITAGETEETGAETKEVSQSTASQTPQDETEESATAQPDTQESTAQTTKKTTSQPVSSGEKSKTTPYWISLLIVAAGVWYKVRSRA